MGEEADYQIDQMINYHFYAEDGLYINPAFDRKQNAQSEMEVFTMADVKKTYSFDINAEKKVYRIKPPLARGSFMARILEPEAYDDDSSAEWGCQLRWPKEDPEVQIWVADMKKLLTKIFVDKFGPEKAKKLMSNPNVRIPLRNGDNEENEEYAGQWFMNVRNKFRQPMIIGPTGKALPADMINDQIVYSGAWYRSRITLKHFNVKGHVIGAFVDILMKIKDGERLDNIIDVGAAEGEFSGFATEDAGLDDAAGFLDDELGQSDAGSTPKTQAPDEDDDFSFLE